MVSAFSVAVLSAAFISAAFATECAEPLARCAGAPGKAYFRYKPCCDENKYACVEAPELGWGRFCVEKKDEGYTKYEKPGYSSEDDHDDDHAHDHDHDHDDEHGYVNDHAYSQKCYDNGIRCQGAPGYAYYEWKPCCDPKASCVEAKELGWGKFCMDSSYKPKYEEPKYEEPKYEEPKYEEPKYEEPKYEEPQDEGSEPKKCYNDLHRCAGAPGHPYFHYMPCCSGAPCVESKDLGWGKFCVPSGGYKVEKPTAEKPKYEQPQPTKPAPIKCYEEGERCAGAPGYAHVPWHGCCHPSHKCVEDVHKGWGRFCVDLDAQDKYSEPVYEEPVYDTTPGYEGAKPKCVKEGEICEDYSACCEGYECVVPWYGFGSKICKPLEKTTTTMPPTTAVYSTAPPSPEPYTTTPKPYTTAPSPEPYTTTPKPYTTAPSPEPYTTTPKPYTTVPSPEPYTTTPKPYTTAPSPEPYTTTTTPTPYTTAPSPNPYDVEPTPEPYDVEPTSEPYLAECVPVFNPPHAETCETDSDCCTEDVPLECRADSLAADLGYSYKYCLPKAH